MKQWLKGILIFITYYIIYIFLIEKIGSSTLTQEKITELSISFSIFSLIIHIVTARLIIQKENQEIIRLSTKVKKLIDLNSTYNFKKLLKRERTIIEREYSRKSLERVNPNSIIKYRIENNVDLLRTDVENALYNLSILNKYNDDIDKLSNYESTNESKYSDKKYKKIETRVFNNLTHKENEFLINIKLEVYYRSPKGKVYERKFYKIYFDAIANIYKAWLNGNKYEETMKQERKIMNDEIRYNVLKRDNYTCQICGATASDGAKLHVDHIIPISKGGKTVMSNLQTLCERCNIGKSNKTEEDFKNDMICPICGSKLVERKGQYGKFIGCSSYPKCYYKREMKQIVDEK